MPSFREAMESALAAIPAGRVATCGMVAEALGDVRAARAVATWASEHPEAPGAHRLVRADGRPVLPQARGAAGADRAPPRFVADLPSVGLLARLRDEQRRLAAEVSEVDAVRAPRSLGGVDVSYEGDAAHAVAVRCDAESLEPLEIASVTLAAEFPYIPSYLAFREFPPAEAAIARLAERPDLLLVDGHGRLHPARFGFACYAGVRLGLPTIGVAKHALAGRPRGGPGARGSTPIELEGSVRGYAWVPPGAVRPIYVSVGHRVSLEAALRTVQRATRSRYPEPLRIADRASKAMKRGKGAQGA